MRIALLLTLIGCSPSTDFDDLENVAAWANTASALATFLPAKGPLELAEERTTPADPACPDIAVAGDVTTVTGDCTDTEGTEWFGTATVTFDGDDRSVALDGYGSGDADAATVDGTWDIRSNGVDDRSFDAVWTQDGLVHVEVDYSGRVEGDPDGATLWNGSGTVSRSGFTDAKGTVDATTVDQLRDGAICNNQNASGTTTLVQKGTEVVVTYDGATDCDDGQSAQVTVDGEDRGSVDGVTCATAPPGAAWAGLIVGLVLGVIRRKG